MSFIFYENFKTLLTLLMLNSLINALLLILLVFFI